MIVEWADGEVEVLGKIRDLACFVVWVKLGKRPYTAVTVGDKRYTPQEAEAEFLRWNIETAKKAAEEWFI